MSFYPGSSSRLPRRGRFRLLGAAILLSAALGSGPAAAQWFGGFTIEGPIPPQRVLSQLRGRGFSEISRPRFDGSVYIVDALNPRGARVRLIVDAFDGEIVERYRLADPLVRDGRSGRIVAVDPFAAPRLGATPRVERAQPQVRKKARIEPRGPTRPAVPAQPGQADGHSVSPAAPPAMAVPNAAAPADDQPASTAAILPPALPAVPVPVVPPASALTGPSKAEPEARPPLPAAESASGQRSVRVIEGVTPAAPNQLPSDPKPDDKAAASSPPTRGEDVPPQGRP